MISSTEIGNGHDPGTTIAHLNGADLAYQVFGAPDAPAIVLVSGAATWMEWWDDGLCERLAAGDGNGDGPYRVIRYDLRDSGQSATGVFGKPSYTYSDLVDDLAALIEHLDAAPAHLVGLSLGGGLVQQIALRRPELVATITLLSTTPSGPGDAGGAELPPPTPGMAAAFAHEPDSPDWSDPESVAAYLIEAERPFTGGNPLDEKRIREIAARIVARAGDQSAASNHFLAESGDGIRADIEAISAPTLVLHGEDDPLFPFPHAERLHRRIAGSRLVPVPRHGHQNPPPSTWGVIVPAILHHIG